MPLSLEIWARTCSSLALALINNPVFWSMESVKRLIVSRPFAPKIVVRLELVRSPCRRAVLNASTRFSKPSRPFRKTPLSSKKSKIDLPCLARTSWIAFWESLVGRTRFSNPLAKAVAARSPRIPTSPNFTRIAKVSFRLMPNERAVAAVRDKAKPVSPSSIGDCRVALTKASMTFVASAAVRAKPCRVREKMLVASVVETLASVAKLRVGVSREMEVLASNPAFASSSNEAETCSVVKTVLAAIWDAAADSCAKLLEKLAGVDPSSVAVRMMFFSKSTTSVVMALSPLKARKLARNGPRRLLMSPNRVIRPRSGKMKSSTALTAGLIAWSVSETNCPPIRAKALITVPAVLAMAVKTLMTDCRIWNPTLNTWATALKMVPIAAIAAPNASMIGSAPSIRDTSPPRLLA